MLLLLINTARFSGIFLFQLTSPKSEHVLQALTENEMHQWIAAVQVKVFHDFFT